MIVRAQKRCATQKPKDAELRESHHKLGKLHPIKPKAGFHPSPRKARGLGTPGLMGTPAGCRV